MGSELRRMTVAGAPDSAADCLAELITCTREQYERAHITRPITDVAWPSGRATSPAEDPYTGTVHE